VYLSQINKTVIFFFFFPYTKLENWRVEQVLPWGGIGTVQGKRWGNGEGG
jgi:hypothetical protein